MALRLLAVLLAATISLAAAIEPPRLFTVYDFDAGIGHIADLAFSSDGRLIAAAGATGYGAWDAQTGDSIRKGASPSGSLSKVAVGGQGIYLAIGGEDGSITIVDLRSGSTRTVAHHRKPVTAIALSRDGRIGASGDAEGSVLLWDPDAGAIGPLNDGGHKKDLFFLSFNADDHLLSASRDLRVVTWDVAGKRALRRATMQSELVGRTLAPNAAAADQEGIKLVLAAQTVSEPRGGMFTDRAGLARPGDMRRENHLIPYIASSGMSGDPVRTGDFLPEHVALSPGGCFAFFTSMQREQPRLHVWGLLQTGDDLVRTDLENRAAAIALEPAGRFVAVASDTGRIRTWRTSGVSVTDCQSYTKAIVPTPAPADKPNIILGSETDPLIHATDGVKIAVLRFDVTALDPTLGDGVAEMVAGQLANTQGIVVVERAEIDAILREMEIQRSGLTTADAVKIGKGLSARKVLMGSVRKLGDSAFMLTARIVDVETQQIGGFREVQCQNCREQDLPAAVGALRRILVR